MSGRGDASKKLIAPCAGLFDADKLCIAQFGGISAMQGADCGE